MLRPDLKLLTRFKTGRPNLKRVNPFPSRSTGFKTGQLIFIRFTISKCAFLSSVAFFLAFDYEMDMYDREKEFGAFLAEKFSSNDRGTSGVVYKDLGDKIKTAMKDPSSVDKNMRFFVKKKGFQILTF